jgi:hypothetical protein
MQHLEEGTIHAWLDGALPSDDAAHVEEHVEHCAECAAMVADARGLIAGASRIVSALDIVPGGVLPKSTTTAVAAPPRSVWRSLHLTPFRAALAASLMVAAGSLFVLRGSRQPVAVSSKFEHPAGVPAASLPAPMAPSPPVVATTPRPASSTADRDFAQQKRAPAQASTVTPKKAMEPSMERVAERAAEAPKAMAVFDSARPVVDSARRVVAEAKALMPQQNQAAQRLEQMRRADSARPLTEVVTTGASGGGRGGRSAAPARDAMGAARAPAPLVSNAYAAGVDFAGCYRVVSDDSTSWPRALPRQFALGNDATVLGSRERNVRLFRDDRADTTIVGSWQLTSVGAALVSLNGNPTTRFILTQGPAGIYAQIDNARALLDAMASRSVPVVRMACR